MLESRPLCLQGDNKCYVLSCIGVTGSFYYEI